MKIDVTHGDRNIVVQLVLDYKEAQQLETGLGQALQDMDISKKGEVEKTCSNCKWGKLLTSATDGCMRLWFTGHGCQSTNMGNWEKGE